ncbi:hypothetical protein HNR23_001435 [Nocardiopsis mwathae]|uniref:Type I restriction enzyme R protein N-terminal domain-containing protein n=1 Tax=Nocardiopsis mwathae TaxID=1472723 RepID=A0A7W9YG79_9ACTN|nr:hypothetical protein [Nocardiopsis mwathae]MBB6171375.1 hypothetical protein [Nocardiopsis mwathae]
MDADTTQVMTRTGEFTFGQASTPQWEAEVRARLAACVHRFSGPLSDLIARDANEGDTRMLVADFLSDALNYSKYGGLTTEYRTSGESIDYGILLDDRVFAFVEVKQCGQELDHRSLRPARSQAAEDGVEWVLLTNGRRWQAHHFGAGDEDGSGLILDVDVLGAEDAQATLDLLFHLTREAVQAGRLDDLRRWRDALEAERLADALLSDTVIEAIRLEVRRRTEHSGHLGDAADIERTLRERVIARGLLG